MGRYPGTRTSSRTRAAVVAAAGTAVAVVAVLSFVVLRLAHSRQSGEPRAEASSTLSATALGLDVFGDGVIRRSDGTDIRLRMPGGITPIEVHAVRDGWLLFTNPRNELWFVSASAPPRLVGDPFSSYAMSADGRVLVMVDTTLSTAKQPTAVAYDLPSLRVLGRRTVDLEGEPGQGAGTIVVGVHGDRALLRQLKHGPGAPSAGVWNWRTGALIGSTTEVLSLSGEGDVLYYVFGPRPTAKARTDESATPVPPDLTLPSLCVNVAKLTDELPTKSTGLCGDDHKLRQLANLAPDGSWAVLTTGDGPTQRTQLARTADLRAGRWQPVPADLRGPTFVRFWDSKETFVAGGPTNGRSTGHPYRRCHVSGRCGPVTLPDGPSDALLVVPTVG